MSMSEREFMLMTPRAFHNKLRGFNHLLHAQYELVRMQTVELLNIQIERKHRIKRPSQLWRFPWESDKAVDVDDHKDRAKRFADKVKRFEERGNKQDDRDIIIPH